MIMQAPVGYRTISSDGIGQQLDRDIAAYCIHLRLRSGRAGTSMKAAGRWPKRSWKAAVVHRNRNVQIIGRAFEEFYFHLVPLGIKFDFIYLQFR
jgi:hypothetical protein